MAKAMAYKVTATKPRTLVYVAASGLRFAQRIPKGESLQAADVISRLRANKLPGGMSKLEELEEEGVIVITEITSTDDPFLKRSSSKPAKKKAARFGSPAPEADE